MTSLVYSTGTVSVSNASAIVTGTGTSWAVALVTGGMFSFAGLSVPIASVESDTSLTLAYPWPGATASGAYAIARETSEAVRAAWINDRLAQILTKLALVGIHPDGAGTLAERNALLPVPAAGYLWLRVEVGFDLEFYKRTASGWDGPFAARGDAGPAGPTGPIGPDGDITWESAWVTATVYTVNQAVSRSGSSYVCTANHTAGASNEPGVGASWTTVWDLMAAKGSQGDPGAGVTDGDKGDISVSGGVWSIDNNVVSYAKMQDVSATARVLGRKTVGAGDPEELTFSDVLDMVGSSATGDILFRSAAGWTRLPKGAAGQVLRQNTALTAPEWVTPLPTSGFRNKMINGAGRVSQRTFTTVADDVYWCDRHYVLTQTAPITPTVLSNVADGIPSMMRLTQTQATAQRMGNAQIVEGGESRALRGKQVTLGGRLRCSAAQAIRYAVLEWTGTENIVTSDVVNSWTNATFTAGQFFLGANLTIAAVGTITPAANTLTQWSQLATISSSCNNLVLFYWVEGTAAQNVTLDMAWGLVEGDATAEADPFSPRHIQQELALCQRYFWRVNAGITSTGYKYSTVGPDRDSMILLHPVQMRAVPSVTVEAGGVFENCSGLIVSPDINMTIGRVVVTATGAYRAYGVFFLLDSEL